MSASVQKYNLRELQQMADNFILQFTQGLSVANTKAAVIDELKRLGIVREACKTIKENDI